jgi:hypothetical protein
MRYFIVRLGKTNSIAISRQIFLLRVTVPTGCLGGAGQWMMPHFSTSPPSGDGIMKAKVLLLALLALTIAFTSGCSGGMKSANKLEEHKLSRFGKKKQIEDAMKDGEWESAADAGEESIFSLGGSGGILGGGGRRVTQQEIRHNKLYAGAMDVVMDLPVQVADRSGGFVSTDWKISPRDPDTRYRLNIRVAGDDPYGVVKVRVLKQLQEGSGGWKDNNEDPSLPTLAGQIEKAIRKRAQIHQE